MRSALCGSCDASEILYEIDLIEVKSLGLFGKVLPRIEEWLQTRI
jgi:hypothetical protein